MKHRAPSRTARRAAAISLTAAAGLALTTGTAAASDDRCERADGVVVCLPADVDLSDLTVNILTHEDNSEESSGFPPGYWDLGP